MSIKNKKEENHGSKWNENEVMQLVEEIKNKTIGEIARIHKRSVGAIESKINSLASKDFSNGKTKEYICEKYKLDDDKYNKYFKKTDEKTNTENTFFDNKINLPNTKKLYVLECKSNKYYVGTTSRKLNDRIEEHFSNYGSEWTKKYKPIKVIESYDISDGAEEDICTKKYMQKFGINNVRGGSYSKIILDDYKISALEDEFCTANNSCFRCGKLGHYSNQCNAVVWRCEFCDMEFKNIKQAEEHEKTCAEKFKRNQKVNNNYARKSCERCGRKGHSEKNCYAGTTIDGESIDSDDDYTDDSDYESNSDSSDICYRCGREGHYSNDCYAKTNINGNYIY